MRPLTDLAKDDIKNIKLVCFDVDGVTVKKGTKITEIVTKDSTESDIITNNLDDRVKDKLEKLKEYYLIAINSGRSSMYLRQVFSDIIDEKVALISENGIFTLFKGELIQFEKFDKETLSVMEKITTDLKELECREESTCAFEPKQFLITLHSDTELSEVYDIVEKYDKKKEFSIIWNGEAFDIAPKHLNKGRALKNLTDLLKIDIKDTMAIANGPNDKTMVDVAGIGVTTEPKELEADFHTTGDQHLGGEELIDKLISLNTN